MGRYDMDIILNQIFVKKGENNTQNFQEIATELYDVIKGYGLNYTPGMVRDIFDCAMQMVERDALERKGR